jgi:hypothetical protein
MRTSAGGLQLQSFAFLLETTDRPSFVKKPRRMFSVLFVQSTFCTNEAQLPKTDVGLLFLLEANMDCR